MSRVADWEAERLTEGWTVWQRMPGRAIVRRDGQFVGAVQRVGTIGWQAYRRRRRGADLRFIGYGPTRRAAVELMTGPLSTPPKNHG